MVSAASRTDMTEIAALIIYDDQRRQLVAGSALTLGRDADLILDDANPHLHREFLELRSEGRLCFLRNIGTRLSATVNDDARRLQAWLAPGALLPLVFSPTYVRFIAGPASYEFIVEMNDAPFVPAYDAVPVSGDTTLDHLPLTSEQRSMLVALAEPLLREPTSARVIVPSTAEAAARLGWPLSKFNRKLDYLCLKLERVGVQGLHGAPGELASGRRARLVEYAIAVGLVGPNDLELLDAEDSAGSH